MPAVLDTMQEPVEEVAEDAVAALQREVESVLKRLAAGAVVGPRAPPDDSEALHACMHACILTAWHALESCKRDTCKPVAAVWHARLRMTRDLAFVWYARPQSGMRACYGVLA